MCALERDGCFPLLGMGNSAAFINPTLLHLFPGFGEELSNPLNDFFWHLRLKWCKRRNLVPRLWVFGQVFISGVRQGWQSWVRDLL